MTTTAHSLPYRPEIDGLRAVAILLVAVFHFRLLPMGEAGFIGVDIFFVISGFLITRILIGDLQGGRFHLGAFYVARLRRLMPALVATLALYLAAGALLFLPDQLSELATETLLSQLYVVNIYFWRTINYFGLRADHVPLLHMWSLAVEEQFYIFYPLALALLFRITRRFLVWVLVAGALASFALGWFATGWKPEASFYLLPTRAWELLAGGVLALFAPQAHTGPRATLAGAVGAGLIVLALFIHTPVTPFPGWFAALPVGGAVLLILGGSQTPIGTALRHPVMIWIGKISYPLYLVHWPIIILQRASMEEVTLIWRWFGFAGAVLLAWAIWRFVETPVRKRQVFASSRQIVLGSLLATGILGAIGGLGIATGGFPGRLSPEARAVLAYANDRPISVYDCAGDPRRGVFPTCPLGAKDRPARIALVGDSHAQALAGAVDLWLTDQNQAGRLYFYHACMPILNAGDPYCVQFTRHTLETLQNDPNIDTVILVSTWRHRPGVYGGKYLDGTEADRALAPALEGMLEGLLAAGKKIILVDPMFSAPNSVPEALARNMHFGQTRAIDEALATHQARYGAVHDLFAKAATNPAVRRISLITELCQDGICRAQLEGAPLFSDNDHIRFGVSPYFADRLKDRLGRLDGSDG